MASRLKQNIGKSNERIEDARERLSILAGYNNLVDMTQFSSIMNELNTSSLPRIDAYILRAETTMTIMEDLLALLKAEKTRKETHAKVRSCSSI